MDDLIDDGGDDQPTAPFWMSTFSDMMTLLLTLFVLIVSMSEVEVKKFKEAMSHFQGRTGVLQNASVIPTPRPVSAHSEETARRRSERYEKLKKYLKKHNLEDKVQLELSKEGMRVTITDSVMFGTGNAELLDASRNMLSLVGGMADRETGSVVVEGHTDDQPIHTEKFPSNWELSTARAASVVRFLQGKNDAVAPDRYAAVGYGPYHPVDTSGTAAARSRNRRVEIFFSWKSWKDQTPLLNRPTPSSPMASR